MGLERIMTSSKLDVRNMEFLDEVARSLKPFEVSQSSLVNICVGIVRRLTQRGQISFTPAGLQEFLGNEGTAGNAGSKKGR
jgi:hypothetical protein